MYAVKFLQVFTIHSYNNITAYKNYICVATITKKIQNTEFITLKLFFSIFKRSYIKDKSRDGTIRSLNEPTLRPIHSKP